MAGRDARGRIYGDYNSKMIRIETVRRPLGLEGMMGADVSRLAYLHKCTLTCLHGAFTRTTPWLIHTHKFHTRCISGESLVCADDHIADCPVKYLDADTYFQVVFM